LGNGDHSKKRKFGDAANITASSMSIHVVYLSLVELCHAVEFRG
jgi:hypothetical protein